MNTSDKTLPTVAAITRVEALQFLNARLGAHVDPKNRSSLHTKALEIEASAFRAVSSKHEYLQRIARAVKAFEKQLIRVRRKKAQEALLAPWATIPGQEVEMMPFEANLIEAHQPNRPPNNSMRKVLDEDLSLPSLELQDEVHQYWEGRETWPSSPKGIVPVSGLVNIGDHGMRSISTELEELSRMLTADDNCNPGLLGSSERAIEGAAASSGGRVQDTVTREVKQTSSMRGERKRGSARGKLGLRGGRVRKTKTELWHDRKND